MIDAAAEQLVAQRGTHGPFNVLEVGSFVGMSAITWGRALERCGVKDYVIVCVDLWEHCDDVQYARPGRDRPPAERLQSGPVHVQRRQVDRPRGVIPMIADSRLALPQLAADWFDAVHIDGFHGETIVRQDLLHARRVCRPGGLICGDDYDCPTDRLADMLPDAFELDGYADMHPGVVRAVDAILGPPRQYGSFWAFRKDRRDSMTALDVATWPRRIPAHIPPAWHPAFATWFAGVAGFPLGASDE